MCAIQILRKRNFIISGSSFILKEESLITYMYTLVYVRLANRPGIPGIVPEIVLLSRRPGNLPNVPGPLPTGFVSRHPFQYMISILEERYSVGRAKAATRGIAQFAEF